MAGRIHGICDVRVSIGSGGEPRSGCQEFHFLFSDGKVDSISGALDTLPEDRCDVLPNRDVAIVAGVYGMYTILPQLRGLMPDNVSAEAMSLSGAWTLFDAAGASTRNHTRRRDHISYCVALNNTDRYR